MAATSSIPAVVATPREGKFNKNAARRVRAAGKIPAVVYGAGQASVAVTVDPRIITKILHSDSGHNTIFDLDVAGAQAKAMVVDWQHDPVKGALLHIDLKRIAMDKAMQVSVPIQLIGVPLGVKAQGGILEHVLREVEVECLPSDIPGHLDVDVSALEINGSVHVSDLPHSAKIKFLSDRTGSCQEGQGRSGSRAGCQGCQGRCQGRRQGREVRQEEVRRTVVSCWLLVVS